jgi:hypothetical protein
MNGMSLLLQTDGRRANINIRFAAHSGSDVTYRVARSDVRAALGNKLDPGFWPARGRRSGAEDTALGQPSQGLWPYWVPRIHRADSEHNINIAKGR